MNGVNNLRILRIHTLVALMSKDHKFSFDHTKHQLQYFPALNMFAVDETMVPVSNIREVLVDTPTNESSSVPATEQLAQHNFVVMTDIFQTTDSSPSTPDSVTSVYDNNGMELAREYPVNARSTNPGDTEQIEDWFPPAADPMPVERKEVTFTSYKDKPTKAPKGKKAVTKKKVTAKKDE